ncbi:hypothetical protein CHS0354_005762 [Potamilus streckersoni]|uniref:Uncharacterized protein n=1 Tax=Potamilus streckersoni TaxID=2493646 RepID=A0AAE0VUC8_9BIVA|nr:hypothetical protein CHS0354_005762 [Potamilus streckersoni]
MLVNIQFDPKKDSADYFLQVEVRPEVFELAHVVGKVNYKGMAQGIIRFQSNKARSKVVLARKALKGDFDMIIMVEDVTKYSFSLVKILRKLRKVIKIESVGPLMNYLLATYEKESWKASHYTTQKLNLTIIPYLTNQVTMQM